MIFIILASIIGAFIGFCIHAIYVSSTSLLAGEMIFDPVEGEEGTAVLVLNTEPDNLKKYRTVSFIVRNKN